MSSQNVKETEGEVKRVCVIGAGTAGLCALKHSIEKGFDVICYETNEELGGTWIYDPNVQSVREEQVQSSIYEGLRTNLPKEVMGYPDFLFPDDSEVSYVSSDAVLNFLQLYARHFDLNKYIRFKHEVIRVRPKNYGKLWEVYFKDLQTGGYNAQSFDFVFVCNGHHNIANYPEIENMDIFRGIKLHSHLYRKSSQFEGETVLIIGAGPSGTDIALQLSSVCKYVLLSHHKNSLPISSSIIQKPDVLRFTENGAIFKDGSVEKFSAVIFCTGYQYAFPFLSVDCGVRIEENSVQPLYKHVLNINYPSMAFIGLSFKTCPTQTIDIQTRFAVKFFTNEKEFPSQEHMLKDLENELHYRKEQGLPLQRFHELAGRQSDYYDDLSKTADIESIKPVITKIWRDCVHRLLLDGDTFRNYAVKVIDDSNFEKFKLN